MQPRGETGLFTRGTATQDILTQSRKKAENNIRQNDDLKDSMECVRKRVPGKRLHRKTVEMPKKRSIWDLKKINRDDRNMELDSGNMKWQQCKKTSKMLKKRVS
ncbi:UNVERIFIED_CONTAM: hypothetical protein K2H54_067040 [Gekko kuhli]